MSDKKPKDGAPDFKRAKLRDKEKRCCLLPIEMQDLLPRVLKDYEAKLFPNSPIEVVFELRSWAVYCEGEWSSNEDSFYGIESRIRELLRQNSEFWPSIRTCLNPTWPGWAKVDQGALTELLHQQLDQDDAAIAADMKANPDDYEDAVHARHRSPAGNAHC